ncbi:MAG: ABC transporter permease [Chloroflexi bacterium]|nr:ABC transporter permease [Chloroflexota bacterium]
MNNDKTHLSIFDSTEHRGFKNILTRNFRDLVTYRYAIYNFISSNLRARYRRSALGFLWTLLNPLFTMGIMAIVFSTIFQSPVKNFSIYIFSGLLPWTLISNSMVIGSVSLVVGEGYLKKVYVPRFLFPLVIVGVEVVNFLLSLISLFFVALLLGAKISWALLALPFALLLTALFILGLVLIASILTVYFRDLSHIIQISFTALFYLTPIIYPVEFLSKSPLLMIVIKWNPFFYFVELFHTIIYQAKVPDISLWLISLGLTTISLALGFVIFSSREKDVIYRL